MLNIIEKTNELLKQLRTEGFGGFKYLDASLDGTGSPDYACVADLVPDTFDLDGDQADYFDFAGLEYDLIQHIKENFQSEEETVEVIRDFDQRRDADLPQTGSYIVLRFYRRNGFEVYRMVDGVVLCNIQETDDE